MKLFMYAFLMFFLSACASNSDIEDIKNILSENNDEVTSIEIKIDKLELDKKGIKKSLIELDEKGEYMSYEAQQLRSDLSKVNVLINDYRDELDLINLRISSNEEGIATINDERSKYRSRIKEMNIQKNKIEYETTKEIKDVESLYLEKRIQSGLFDNEEAL